MSKKVYLMLSGGVDSSSSLAVLLEQGYELFAVYMKCWSKDQIKKLNLSQDLYDCSWEDDLIDARLVAKKLNVKFEVWDLQKEYLERVVGYMINNYKLGITPNPDIMCNSQIKFGVFLTKALEKKADFVASGHYARVINSSVFKNKKGFENINFKNKKILARGLDSNKDQSYFLCRVKPNVFSQVLFPAGDFASKQLLRNFAQEKNLITANKKDSQGLCFVGKTSLREMLKQKIGQKAGQIINQDNQEILGNHPGSYLYTIGQRSDLGLSGGPWFVSKIDIEKNQVFVKHGKYKQQISTKKITARDLNLFIDLEIGQKIQATAQIRYRQEAINCQFYLTDNDSLAVEFENPAWAVSPGQSVVLYKNDIVLGSGVIDYT